MLELETPLQRWILASQRELLARSQALHPVEEQPRSGEAQPGSERQPEGEQVFFPGE